MVCSNNILEFYIFGLTAKTEKSFICDYTLLVFFSLANSMSLLIFLRQFNCQLRSFKSNN
jgi:hypothetical protein